MNMNIIAKYLQFLRKSNNYTQDDLAEELGISRQAVSKWETGTTIPDIDFEITRKNIGRIRIKTVEDMQHQIVAMINLQSVDKEI